MQHCEDASLQSDIAHLQFQAKNTAIFQHYLNKYRMSLSTLPTTHIEIINPPKRVVFLQKQKIIFQLRFFFKGICYAKQKKHHKKGSRVPIDFIITDKKRFLKKMWFLSLPKSKGPSQSRRMTRKNEAICFHGPLSFLNFPDFPIITNQPPCQPGFWEIPNPPPTKKNNQVHLMFFIFVP